MTEDSLFADAIAIPDPTAAAEFLERARQGDANLRRGAEALIAAHYASNPGGLRRPLWLNRPLRPALEAFHVKGAAVAAVPGALPSEETWYYMI